MALDTRTYSSGSGNDAVPTGATSVTIKIVGGGGGGARAAIGQYANGGGAGYSEITRSVLSGEWGTNLAYAVGAAGSNETTNTANNAAAGGNTTISGTLNGSAFSLAANGGGATNTNTGGAGGTASGGSTNTTGATGDIAYYDGETWVPDPFAAAPGNTIGASGKGYGGAFASALAPTGGYIEIVYTVTIEHSTTPNSVSSASSVGQPALTQDHSLTPTGVASASSVGNPALTEDATLAPSSVASAPSVGQPALTQEHILTPSSVASASSVDNLALTQDHILAPTDVSVASDVGAPALTQDHSLAPNSIVSASSVGNPALTLTFPTWPAALPQFVEQSSYREDMAALRLDTQTDFGPGKSRKRFTANWRYIQCAIRVTADQVETFMDFYDDDLNGGVAHFAWVNAITQTSGRFRFTGGEPRIVYVEADQYLIEMKLYQVA